MRVAVEFTGDPVFASHVTTFLYHFINLDLIGFVFSVQSVGSKIEIEFMIGWVREVGLEVIDHQLLENRPMSGDAASATKDVWVFANCI